MAALALLVEVPNGYGLAGRGPFLSVVRLWSSA